jgi:hypothetical protein
MADASLPSQSTTDPVVHLGLLAVLGYLVKLRRRKLAAGRDSWDTQDSTKSGPRRANVRPHGNRN